MIKQLILLFHVFGMFLYQFIFSGDVTVIQQLPSKMNPGEEVVVEIIIHKDQLTGFSKVQQVLPAGFSAEVVESKGATFSFKDNKVKFIWMALPSEEEFTISYKLKADETTSGDFTIGGKFSFIFESERKNIEISPSTISVSQEVLANNEEEPKEEEVTEEVTEDITQNPVEEATEKVSEVAIPAEPKINCVRTITEKTEGNYTVSLTVTKENIKGFSKIIEQIPTGFTATEGESSEGIFSFKNQEAKILWMSVPKDKELKVSYHLVAAENTPNKDYQVNGTFSYLHNDETNKHIINPSTIQLNFPEEVIANEPEKTEEKEETNDEVMAIEEKPTITSTPNPETGVSYKVQVAAGHKTVANNYFASKFNLTDEISTINHEGWIKYLVGNFNEYKQARDKRNTVRGKINTAFVTAYNSGKRITVQEALMISNQKWYK